MPDLLSIKEFLKYDPESGNFIWIKKRGNKTSIGDVAGRVALNGYVMIGFRKKIYYAHQLAFFFMTGELVKNCDHIDRNRSNNKWSNLRRSNRSLNNFNRGIIRKQSNPELPRGVSRYADGTLFAQIKKDGKNRYLGSFNSIEEAAEAYRTEAIKLYGEEYVSGIFVQE